jgi:ankyrin
VNAKSLTQVVRTGNIASIIPILGEHPHLAKEWAPIMDAVFYGQTEVVKLFLNKGANPNTLAANEGLHRPLHRAIESSEKVPRSGKHVQIVKILIEAGAKVDALATPAMVNPVVLAAMHNEHRFLELLIENMPEPDLYTSVALGDQERVYNVVDDDSEMASKKDRKGREPILYCCLTQLHQSDEDTGKAIKNVAQSLLDEGASPDAQGSFSASKIPLPALFYAVGHAKNLDVADLLLQSGANPNAGGTLLHASNHFHFQNLAEGTEYLISHGQNPDYQDEKTQDTALHIAARHGNTKAMQTLLNHGANFNLTNADGKTPLEIGQEANQKWVVDMILRHKKKMDQPDFSHLRQSKSDDETAEKSDSESSS